MSTQIPVTVNVLTYNSSKYVLETLESIKTQTYQPLILHICDDCSTDDTVKICKKWIGENSDRFIKTKVIVPEYNTGISANLNRGMDACETEWFKTIAGDDILKPECIETYVQYVAEHQEAVVVFSRLEVFGASEKIIMSYKDVFDYSFFHLSLIEQYESLFKMNCIPAPTAFFNVNRLRELGVRADDRIPLVEDYPLWINLVKKNVKFYFVDKTLVKYRTGDGISSSGSISCKYMESLRMCYFLYIFPTMYKNNAEEEIKKIVRYEIALKRDLEVVLHSPSFRLGNALLGPLRWLRKFVKRSDKIDVNQGALEDGCKE